MFVDGERRATGKFVGRRLCSRFPSPSIHNLSEQGRPNTEPLRLGSRGKQDYWRGRLCGMRVWGEASSAADLRRRAKSFPSASLVRAPPPPCFEVAVSNTQQAFRRMRVHAPLPDPSKGAADAPGVTVHGAESKAYYEVSLARTFGRGRGLDMFPVWFACSVACLIETLVLGPMLAGGTYVTRGICDHKMVWRALILWRCVFSICRL